VSANDDRLLHLRRVAIFAECPVDVLQGLAAALVPVALPAGARVFSSGEPGSALFIIVSGQVRVHEGELTYNELGPGNVFGEMSLLDAAPRSASVTALSPLILYRLDQDALLQAMATDADVTRRMLAVLSGHLRHRMADATRDHAYLSQVARITATAQALETGDYQPDALDDVARRTDELGQLARVFQHMAHEVYAREQRLRREVHELRIEVDRARQARQVAEITGSDYFQQLRQSARALRDESDEEP
jgi:CRP-like cAMP-binding protein